LLIRLR